MDQKDQPGMNPDPGKRLDVRLPRPRPYDDHAHYDQTFTSASDILSRRQIDQGHVDRAANMVSQRERPYHDDETDEDKLVRRAARTMFQAWHDAAAHRLAEQTAQSVAERASPAPQRVIQSPDVIAQGEQAQGR